jgi:hypothetical protein
MATRKGTTRPGFLLIFFPRWCILQAMTQDGKKVNIFVASSGELAEERKETILIVDSINKNFHHLELKVIRWEIDLESGSYEKEKIQDEINPLLDASDIVFVLVYSKIGEYTLEEYNLAMAKNKKVFLYFKRGFSADTLEEIENKKKVIQFRNRVKKENKILCQDYQTIDQFKHMIRTDLDRYLSRKFPLSSMGEAVPLYLTRKPAKNVKLVGREDELKEMALLLERSDRVLLVNGLGGVGKTELCKRYFWDNIHGYRSLAWVDVVGSIRESLVNAFLPRVIGGREEDTMDERFETIIAFLDRLDKHSLLVADNIENPGDPDLQRLRELPIKVIANSRLNFEGFETHTLDFLSPETCKGLFYTHYKGKPDDVYVEKIVERCGRHTLSVELLARTARRAAVPVKALYETLAEKGFNLNAVIGDKVHTFWHDQTERERFFNHLLKIFDLSDVTEDERYILANLSVLPPIYIPISDVLDWLGLETNEAVNSLVFKGWLRKEEQGFGIFMHQVIQEVVRYKTSPDAGTCKTLIRSLTRKLGVKPTDNPIHKKKYIIFAETLLRHIEKNEQDIATLSNNLSEIYWHMGSLEKALEFQLKNRNILEQVLDKNHPDLATSYNNLSAIYQDLGQPEKALEFQLKDRNILEQVLDKNHPDLATSYNNLSLIYQALGQPEKALEFQLKTKEILEEVLDKNHPSLATSYNNLALLYHALKDYESAANYGEKAVAILQQLFPNGHPDLDLYKSNLEWVLEEWERSKTAKKRRS